MTQAMSDARSEPLGGLSLRLDPNARPSARKALDLPYFSAEPAAELRPVGQTERLGDCE